jgi:2-keto-4-pentenoate hydratase
VSNREDQTQARARSEDLAQCASALRRAQEQRRPLPPLRNREGFDLQGAYQIQELNTLNAIAQGRSLIGRKIGLTSEAVQKQLGIDSPDYGMLFADMQLNDAGTLQLTDLIQPKVEAEIAFVLRADLRNPETSREDLIAAIDYAVPALEIVDSRIENWDIGLLDTIADNASSARFVLGQRRARLSEFDPAACAMTLYASDAVVSKGEGRLCLGSPVNSALWLARRMVVVGRPLCMGDVVLTGALGPMVTMSIDTRYRAEISDLGSVEVTVRK